MSAAPEDPKASAAEDDVAGLENLLNRRYSCRGFLPTQIPRATIERIVSMARRTPSWCNSQPWQLTITSGPATDRFRAALLAHIAADGAKGGDLPFPREYRGEYHARRRECGFQLYDCVGIARGDREASNRQAMENFRLFGAPHVAILTSDEALGTYGAIDCGAFVNNFMLAACGFGVASIAQAAVAAYSDFIRGYFGIGDDRVMICAISFGLEDRTHPANAYRTRRAEVNEIVSFVAD